MDDVATGIGHHGSTYGFETLSGYYPKLNASISIMTNQDLYLDFVMGLSCKVIEIVAQYKGFNQDLLCREIQTPMYTCFEGLEDSCLQTKKDGITREECETKCKKPDLI
jgi:hypothetical protein